MSEAAPNRRVTLSKTAQRGIKALPEHALIACKNLLRELAGGGIRGKKLKGDLSNLRSLRLGRNHRIIYVETAEEIQVVDVGARGDIYKR